MRTILAWLAILLCALLSFVICLSAYVASLLLDSPFLVGLIVWIVFRAVIYLYHSLMDGLSYSVEIALKG